MNIPWPVLKFLNDQMEIHKSRNKLPHWQQQNSTYFLTYRLDDSIPAAVLLELKNDRAAWLESNPKPWTEDTEKLYHRLFSSKVDQLLDDCHGSCLFRDPGLAAVLTESFRHFDRERYLIHTSAIMPNHVHLLFSTRSATDLPTIISTWKRFTATRINRIRGTNGALWQKDYFDRMIRNWDHFINVARYIRRNPSKAKLRPGEYQLYSAPWIDRLLS